MKFSKVFVPFFIAVFNCAALQVIHAEDPAIPAVTARPPQPKKEGAGILADGCPLGYYGVLCSDLCNCQNNSSCNRSTGHCPNGCVVGYKEPICDVCAEDFFGVNCNGTCHCLNGSAACNQDTGHCNGGCAIGYNGPACQNLTGFPVIVSIGNDDIVNVGETVTVACTTSGEPFPNITLTSHNFSVIENSAADFIDVDTKALIVMFQAINIPGTSELMCEAANVHGAVNFTFNITTVDPPELKYPPQIGDVTAENVALIWTPWQFSVDKGGAKFDDPEYMVSYRMVGASDWLNGSSWLATDRATVEHLLPDTDYEFAVQSRRHGAGGEGPVGQSAQAVTKCRAPNAKGTPVNLTAVIKSATTVHLKWQAPSLEDLGCFLSEYNLSYRIKGNMQLNTTVISFEKLEYEVNDLKPGSLYICYLVARTSFKHGYDHAEVTFQTPNQVPGPVQNLVYEPFGSGSRHSLIKWAHPTNTAESAVKEYIVTAQLLNISSCNAVPAETNITSMTVKTAATQVNLTDMYPFSKYLVSLHTLSQDNELGEGTNLTVETMEDVPDVAPPKVLSVAENKTTLLFQWDTIPCNRANGAVFYRYSLRPNVNKTVSRKKRSEDWVVKDHETYDSKANFTGLNPLKSYEFSVRGVTGAGEGPAAIVVHKKADNVSSTPQLSFLAIHSTSVAVQISPPDATDGKIVGYSIRIGMENDSKYVRVISLGATQYLDFIDGLLPYTNYRIQCRAQTDIGWSEWSESKTFQTKEGRPMAPFIDPVKQLNSSSVMVQWQAPVVINGIIQCYKVIVNVTSDKKDSKSSEPLLTYETTNNSTTTATLDGLKLETSYTIHVTAKTGAGYGIAAIKNFTMDTYKAADAPSILDYKVLNGTAVYVQWKSPKITNGTILNYKLEFQVWPADILDTRNKTTNTVLFETTDNDTTTVTYNGLIPEMSYTLSVMAKTEYGYGSPDSRNFTMVGIDDAPIIVVYKILNGTAVYVEWKPPEYIRDTILSYKLDFKIVTEDIADARNRTTDTLTFETTDNVTTSLTCDGLIPKMTYMLSVMTKMTNGPGGKIYQNFTMPGLDDSRRTADVVLPPPPPVIIQSIPHVLNSKEVRVVVKLFPTKTDSFSQPRTYQVVVAEYDHSSKLNGSELPNYYEAQANEVHYWIAAELSSEFFSPESSHEFVVGDKLDYNGYYNGPLKADKKYSIMTRAFGESSSTASYLSPMAVVSSKDEDESKSVFGPCIFLGISCIWFLLIVIILLFLFWIVLALIILFQRRKKHGKKQKKSKNISKMDKSENVLAKSYHQDDDITSLTVFVQTPDDYPKTETFKKSDFFGPILVKDLADYINLRSAHPTLKFQEEFMVRMSFT